MGAPAPTADTTVDEPGKVDASTASGSRLPVWANPRLGLVLVIVVLIVLFSSLRPAFLDIDLSVVPMQADLSVFAVVGLAQMAALSLGHMNLAVPHTAAVSAFAMGWTYQHWNAPLWLGLLCGLAVGALIGALAGAVIVLTGVNSFVVTLALDFALTGAVALLYSRVGDGTAFAVHPAGMDALRNDTLADYCTGNVCGPNVPLVAPIALVVVLAVGVLYRFSRVGREILMTGSNARAARLSGVPTALRIVQAHTLSGGLAAMAGFLLAINSGAFAANVGDSFLLPSFLGPVLGGTALAGGAVSVLGTVFGAALTEVIQNGLNLLEFSLPTLNVYIGVVLLVALSADRGRSILADRRAIRAASRRRQPGRGTAA